MTQLETISRLRFDSAFALEVVAVKMTKSHHRELTFFLNSMQAAEGLFRFSYFDLSPLHCPFPIFDQIFIKIMNWQFRSQKGNLS